MVPSSGIEYKTAGSAWIAPYQKKPWPVVICDESTAPPTFLLTRVGPRHLPAILLGRHKYVWVSEKSLEEWSPNRDYLASLAPFEEYDIQNYDNAEVTMEKQRRMAFSQDIGFMKDHHYWHNYIVNQSEARKADFARRNRGQPQLSNSALQPSTPRYQTSKRPREDDDCMIVGVQRRPSQSHQSKATNSRSATANTPRRRRPSPAEESPTARKASRRKPQRHIIFETDTETEGESEAVAKAILADISRPSTSEDKKNRSSQQVKVIFVEDNVDIDIFLPKTSLAECEFLRVRSNFSKSDGCDIVPLWIDTVAMERKLTSKEMQRVVQYFETGDIGPTLRRNKHSQHPFGPLGPTLRGQHAEDLGMAFITASKISHVKLQELIFEKLRALHPLPGVPLLTLALMYSSMPPPETEAEEELGRWVVEHVVESYPMLRKNHPEVLDRVMEGNSELKSAVLGRLAKDVREENGGYQDETVPAKRGA